MSKLRLRTYPFTYDVPKGLATVRVPLACCLDNHQPDTLRLPCDCGCHNNGDNDDETSNGPSVRFMRVRGQRSRTL